MAASAASRELFTAGVRAEIHRWPVLQIAVDQGFGGAHGPQKADWIADVVEQYFHDNADLQQCEVEDFIAQLMDQEFDTVVDDGSLPQVCASLCQMFSQWQQGALQQLRQTVDKLTEKKTERAKVKAQAAESEEESDEDTEAMECEATSSAPHRTQAPPPLACQEEEDGWTVVRKKK
ncbi:pre-rRNA-processing protein TSR2 homolog [Genypterus blacodes]|uniref:pre-rRNA-processing protein TSR2 homolog n=1 Tax=Genypterus blacodes TaxID=154954 RepID=UPI003F761943